MKNAEKKVWGMISPPIIYFFMQISIEVVLALFVFVKQMIKYNSLYNKVDNSVELQAQMQNTLIDNASYI